jgi:transcriptional regulator with XRE-family HTH domain
MKEYQRQSAKATGEKIQMTRLKKGLSLTELAAKSNVSAATISKMEKGERNFRMSTFFKIGAALEVNFSTLVGDDEIILKQLLDFEP